MELNSYTKKIGAFSSATLLSRILGYVRDALVASYFGGGAVTDAFYAAFKLPNLLRRFLGEGALTAAFVPVFTSVKVKKGEEEAEKLFQSLFTGLFIILFVVVIVGILAAPFLTRIIAWGFVRNPDQLRLTTELVRLTFPFLLVVCLAALLSAVHNSYGRFFTPAISPSGLSLAEIFFILAFASLFESPIYGLAISAVFGGALHFFWQVPGLNQFGIRIRFRNPFAHPEVKSVLWLIGPTILGLCSDQVNSFVDQFFASFLRSGSISALYNSNRIMQLPLALFGVAVSSVALPSLSKSASAQNPEEFKLILNRSLRLANFVLIPSVMGLIVMGRPIVKLLFERGQFTAENSALTYLALVPYALGLPAYSAVKILATGFYAHKDTKNPVKISLFTMFLNIPLNYLLMKKFEVGGLALATALSAWVQVIMLFMLLRKKIGPVGGKDLLTSFIVCTFATLLGAAFLIFVVNPLLIGQKLIFQVFLSIGISVLVYIVTTKIFKIEEAQFVSSFIFRKKQLF